MPRRSYTTRDKVQAVARLEAGESVRDVSKALGCSTKQLAKWRDRLVELRPELFPNLSGAANPEEMAEEAAEIAQRIKEKTERTIETLLDRLLQLAPHENRFDKVAIAFGILSDKLAVAQGKPTAITGEVLSLPDDATPEQLTSTIEELRRRRQQAPPDVGSGGAQKPQLTGRER